MSTPVWNAAFAAEPREKSAIGAGDDAIVRFKAAVADILGREHYFELSGSNPAMQGYLRGGSGKAFVQETSPTVRPNGTAFDETDKGRLWYQPTAGLTVASGMYVLTSVDEFGVPTWQQPSEGWVGQVAWHSGVTWVNPSSANWYTSGTKPGWFKADGSSVQPPGYDTPVELPDLVGQYVKGADATNLTPSGENEVSLTMLNIPRHTHLISQSTVSLNDWNVMSSEQKAGKIFARVLGRKGTGATVDQNTEAGVTQQLGDGWPYAGVKIGTARILGSSDTGVIENYFSKTLVNHHHAFSIEGETAYAGEEEPDAFSVEPQHVELIPIVRMY